MADPASNWFEIERRVITWSPLSTLNDKITPLGYNGDPNLVNPLGTPGEQWLYNLPIGQFYKQTNATLWWKNGTPNTWINIVTGGGAGVTGIYTGPTVAVADVVTISASDTVIPANASNPSENPIIGVCISKPTGTTAEVQLAGEISVFAGLTPNVPYYLAKTAGQITTSVASYTSGDVVQLVGISKNATTLVLRLDSRIIL